MNAWSLLYDVMSENYEKSKYYYDFDRNKEPTKADGYSVDGKSFADVWKEMDKQEPLTPASPTPPSGVSVPSPDAEIPPAGTINIHIDNTNGYWKYSEDIILKEIRDYLGGTYKAHYAGEQGKAQTLDLIESIGAAEPFCRSNAIKYLSRFGKKNGKSQLDILKAIHYCILLYHFSGLTKQPKGNYETF